VSEQPLSDLIAQIAATKQLKKQKYSPQPNDFVILVPAFEDAPLAGCSNLSLPTMIFMVIVCTVEVF
jgi:hypothetical protein